MIYQKNGRWEMVINAGIEESTRKRRSRPPIPEDLRRGEIRRKIEEIEELRAIEKGDLW